MNLFHTYGLICQVHGPTPDRGGTLDIVASRSDLLVSSVDITDPGLSDHRLITWSSSLSRPPPIYHSITFRPWHSLNILDLRSVIASSSWCAHLPSSSNPDYLAELFDELNFALDSVLPQKTIRCRPRSSDLWFDEDCRSAKREVRRTERRFQCLSRNDPDSALHLATELKIYRRGYKDLTRQRRESFWKRITESVKNNPRLVWSTINSLMGRCHHNPNSNISAQAFHQHMADKVTAIHDRTSALPPPTFCRSFQLYSHTFPSPHHC